MSIINSQPRIGAAGQSTGFKIERSLRFNSADSAYLNRTPASAGSRTTWTWSAWIKRSGLGTLQYIFTASGAATGTSSVAFNADNTLEFYTFDSSYTARLTTSQVFRDVSAWYHIVAVFDTTSATTTLTGSSTDRMRLYVNGVQVSNFANTTVPSQNYQGFTNSNVQHVLNGRYNGSYVDTNGNWYMTEVQFIDGSALTAASFGETDTDTGVWKPKAYSGTYGTNGFYLKFADNSGTTSTTLGKDSSGNGNNWTPNNFSVTAGAGNDSLVDTPTPYGIDTGAGGEVRGNYATWNPLDTLAAAVANYTNGNLDTAYTTANYTGRATMAVTSGKWYWEITITTAGNPVAIATAAAATNQYPGQNASSWGYYTNGNKYTNGSASAYGNSYTTGDVIGVAFDADGGNLYFYKNGTVQNSGTAAFTSLTSGPYFPAIGNGVYVANFGQRPFAYTAPSGFKALCTQNLPTPTIGATATTRADDYFNTVLYTGNASTQSITGVGFQPDFVWTKSRANAYSHLQYDAVRGATKYLSSNTTNAEGTLANSLISFNSDGFTLGADDNSNSTNGSTAVAWNWKANGAGSSNTAGSITSTVSANTTAGFSIVAYNSGASGDKTVGHGLGVAPSMIITKSRSSASYNWSIYHASVATTVKKYLTFTTGALDDNGSNIWGSAFPTSSVFGISSGNGVVASTDCIAYCFAPVAGYSAFGSYTGNGSTDGPFVFCGFRPAYVLVKRSSTAGNNWQILDTKRSTYNVMGDYLYASASNAEAYDSSVGIDALSNGFKIRGTDTNVNGSGSTYVYAAFAEVPQKFSLAR